MADHWPDTMRPHTGNDPTVHPQRCSATNRAPRCDRRWPTRVLGHRVPSDAGQRRVGVAGGRSARPTRHPHGSGLLRAVAEHARLAGCSVVAASVPAGWCARVRRLRPSAAASPRPTCPRWAGRTPPWPRPWCHRGSRQLPVRALAGWVHGVAPASVLGWVHGGSAGVGAGWPRLAARSVPDRPWCRGWARSRSTAVWSSAPAATRRTLGAPGWARRARRGPSPPPRARRGLAARSRPAARRLTPHRRRRAGALTSPASGLRAPGWARAGCSLDGRPARAVRRTMRTSGVGSEHLPGGSDRHAGSDVDRTTSRCRQRCLPIVQLRGGTAAIRSMREEPPTSCPLGVRHGVPCVGWSSRPCRAQEVPTTIPVAT